MLENLKGEEIMAMAAGLKTIGILTGFSALGAYLRKAATRREFVLAIVCGVPCGFAADTIARSFGADADVARVWGWIGAVIGDRLFTFIANDAINLLIQFAKDWLTNRASK